MKTMTNKRGFTLVELLIAISVLAIVAVLGWRGLDSIVRARVALNSDLEQTRGLQLAFAQMQSDASRIAIPAKIGGRAVLDAQAGRLTLVRTVFADNQPSRMQVVAYRVLDGVLSRRESVATRDLKELDASWSAMLGDTDAAQPVLLQSEVSRMAMRTWGSDGAGWRTGTGAAPGTAAPVSNSGANPAPGAAVPAPLSVTGLEVSLQLRNRPAELVKVFLLGPI